MAATTASRHDVLVARAVAYALLAQLLGPDPTPLTDTEHLDALREALDRSGDTRAAARLADVGPRPAGEVTDLTRRWIRWFDHGRIAPYECSNTPPSAGGHTPRLADVAGFYKAFGMAVSRERPDHVVAELEFASVVSLSEAQARERADDEAADVCAQAARVFLRDHLGGWLDTWAARIGETDVLAPWAPFAAAAADLVTADAASRNVVPVRSTAAFTDAVEPFDDQAPLPYCGSDSED
jgi:nitrate reductase assembly molybdenum cofactor insertion protein NarJ